MCLTCSFLISYILATVAMTSACFIGLDNQLNYPVRLLFAYSSLVKFFSCLLNMVVGPARLCLCGGASSAHANLAHLIIRLWL